MRSGWLSYIRHAYPEGAAEEADPLVEEAYREGMLVLPN